MDSDKCDNCGASIADDEWEFSDQDAAEMMPVCPECGHCHSGDEAE